MKKGQAERLFPMLEEVLDAGNSDWHALDAIGVGIGPGNFTGIRIAVSAARGLALSLDVPAIGVSGFDILRDGDNSVFAALPAPRDMAYIAYWGDADWSEPKLVDPYRAGQDFTVPDGAVIRGHMADVIEQFARTEGGGTGYTVSEGTISRPTQRIARIAAARFSDDACHDAPTALYIRPADAAPASDPPPVLLP